MDLDEALPRARSRQLDLLKGALLGTFSLEHEARIQYLLDRIDVGRPPEVERLRDPVRHDTAAYQRIDTQRHGPAGPDDSAVRSFLPYTAIGRARLDAIESALDHLRTGAIDGDLVEVHAGGGGVGVFLRGYLDAYELVGRRVWVVDRFRASAGAALAPTFGGEGLSSMASDINRVRDAFALFGLLDDRVRFLQGDPVQQLASGPEAIALLHVGTASATEITAILSAARPRLVAGAQVIVDIGDDPAARAAVEDDRLRSGDTGPLVPVDARSVRWQVATVSEGAAPTAVPVGGVPLAAPAVAPIDLSVVVVFYNMRREAARTLHSLSRVYQEGVDDISYEVIVVDNGSSPEQRLDEEFVAGFGPEFTLVDMGEAAPSTPVTALNEGIRRSRGRNVALMIDGAHVLTPGVIRFGLAGLDAYAPAIVATQQWYMGPGQQGDTMDDGYDQVYEDRLFEAISWPDEGYRLFEISHFIGDRDWLDGMWESNCIFVARSQLEQVGGFEEGFSMAGGGYANLELYERLGSSPDVTVATILGEASFHQVHGGTTTNQIDPEQRRSRVFGYSQHYAEMRGRAFRGPGKPIHYIGRFHAPLAKRTNARRMTASAFAEGATLLDGDGYPTRPTPVPDELRTSFTESVWRSMPWSHTSWLGRPIHDPPTDLLAFQEVIAAVRPDWIIEAGTGDGGRTLFLATMCDMVGNGRVISIDDQLDDDLPQHDRVIYVRGRPHGPHPTKSVGELVGEGPVHAMVVLGATADRFKTAAQFEAYHRYVSVGSYVIVTNTIVNGHPVWPAFGPGPLEGVKRILREHGDFVADPFMEKYSLSFNPGGYLRRVR